MTPQPFPENWSAFVDYDVVDGRKVGILSNFCVRVRSEPVARTFTLRRNGEATYLSVLVPAGHSGVFCDELMTDTFGPDDDLTITEAILDGA